jgi:tetrahydromethanopterin S-methyltransferase subunit G
MLSRCRGSINMDKLNSKFKNANTSIELLQKIGDQNKLIGILMGFKYFKSMINKYAKLSSKKKKLESLIDLNKLNEKLDHLSHKMEALEKTMPWKNSNSSIKSFSLNSASTDSVYAVHSATPHPYIDL